MLRLTRATAKEKPTEEELAKRRAQDAAEFAKLSAWFDSYCEQLRPLWDARVNEIVEQEETEEEGDRRTRAQIERTLAKNAADDLLRLENEISLMLVRTSVIVAAATLLFAVFALKSSSGRDVWEVVGITLFIIGLLLTAVAFIAAIRPLAPPFERAMKQPYEKRHHWTLLAKNDRFDAWAISCWLGDRRTPVITKYKKAHAIAARLLVMAAIIIVPGLAFISATR